MKIAFLGDIAFVGQYDLTKNPDAKALFHPLAEYLSGFDLVVANLESPFTKTERSGACKAIHVKSDPINISLLQYLNIGVVSLANNHIFDFGVKGYRDTVTLLEQYGIKHFGVNEKTLSLQYDNNRLSFYGYCCYTSNGRRYHSEAKKNYIPPIDEAKIQKQIEKEGELAILSLHWGDENVSMPRYEHRRFARRLSEQCPYILHGHHPHVLQGAEVFNNALLSYSLGNFCFDEIPSRTVRGLKNTMSDQNKSGCVLSVEVENNQILAHEFQFFQWENGGVRFVENSDFSEYCDSLNIEEPEYTEKRTKELAENRELVSSGKRNFSWIFKRLNYYYIGAFLSGMRNQLHYRKTFLNQ